MPRPHPKEFRDDVVAIARRGEAPVKQIAEDFGISESCLRNWLHAADVEDGNRPGVTASESAELRELRRRNRQLEQEVEVLRRAAAYLSQAHLPKMIYPLVSELAGDGIPVTVTCRVLKLARQPYYRWLAAPVGARELEEAYLANVLFDAHRDDPEFGYRLLADEASRAGLVACDRTVWRICAANRWWSVFGKKRARSAKKAGAPAHEDLVLRQFRADTPNRLWLWDITEHPTAEGKVYLCAIKDVYSNRIVGYSISDRMTSRIAVNALVSAVQRRRDVAGCIVHSDRGSQFRSRKVRRVLDRHDLVGSMGQVASAGDNAAMESFFSLLQKNVLNRRRWTTREDLRLAIITWIERTYHRRRRQARLGRLTPIEYEAIMTTQVALAA
ncbi:IS3 family transposase [Cellulosimicrobium cellulans]|uniref:IS3 family transposase n=1 Tax=Cellulosimicrobium cellulans TaxID=1710 RepID=UPI001BA6140D|nr:IS3 family transposase [Cellulosimicrobium cellulans]QUB98626.1 IS3 family transposase [Cellulosimicrobium cellulans]QUB99078.1 IS3 family transposase [Cellulosimicrobium cellulans]